LLSCLRGIPQQIMLVSSTVFLVFKESKNELYFIYNTFRFFFYLTFSKIDLCFL